MFELYRKRLGLYGKNENESRYPASITKVMTALVVLEHCSLDEPVTFSHESVTDTKSLSAMSTRFMTLPFITSFTFMP